MLIIQKGTAEFAFLSAGITFLSHYSFAFCKML